MQSTFFSGRAVAFAFLLTIETACSATTLHAPDRTSLVPSHSSGREKLAGQSERLYVANFAANNVTIYRANQQNPSPIDTLTDGVVAPRSLYIDSSGTLYVSNDFGQNNPYSDTVTEFVPGAHTPTKTLTGLIFPGAVAVDSQGAVYVQDSSAIQVYEGGATTPTRSISGFGNGANAFAVDDRDDLYALLAEFRGPNELCYSYVVKIPHGASRGSRVGVAVHGCGDGIAFDSHDDIYVAYFANDNTSHIDVFHKNAHTPFRSITQGLSAPQQIAIGPHDTLFVPNDNGNNVTVYPAGGGVPKNTITSGIMNPFAAAVWPRAPY